MTLNLVRATLAGLLLCIVPTTSEAGTVTFGSGANTFTMDFATIGNPGNAADTTGAPNPAGAVAYEYGLGKFEVSEDMINKFNNSQSLTITKNTRGTAKPATNVSWNEAARFVNWLNTSTGNQAAYKFTTSGVNDNIALWTAADTLDYDATNPYRSKRATYVLPSYNEWYKAAFYDQNKNGGAGGYWRYTNGSDAAPTAVASGTNAGTAVYDLDFFSQGPADVTLAGGLSPYGVMGLGGNVWESQESSQDLLNSSVFSERNFRGGGWNSSFEFLLSQTQASNSPDGAFVFLGFRVASLEL